MLAAHRVFPMVLGNTMNSHKVFMDRLKSKVKLREVSSENDCDDLFAFVPIVSRAGTDIQAALKNIHRHSYKHIILVALHHTHDPECIAPDSRHTVHRSDVFAVDCLFHEDQGLLKSQSNDEALKRVIKHLGGEKSSFSVVEMLNSHYTQVTNTLGVANTVRIFWILALLSFFTVSYLLPEKYNFFAFFNS